MKSGYPIDFSMVSCPNRVLTPLKSTATIRISSFVPTSTKIFVWDGYIWKLRYKRTKHPSRANALLSSKGRGSDSSHACVFVRTKHPSIHHQSREQTHRCHETSVCHLNNETHLAHSAVACITSTDSALESRRWPDFRTQLGAPLEQKPKWVAPNARLWCGSATRIASDGAILDKRKYAAICHAMPARGE
jgi:hypothetical protein